MTSITRTGSRTPRRRLSAAERREQLLDATKAIAFERGFHAVSIEAVARESGVTRPVVYNHFADLGALLEALIDREGERALGQLQAILAAELGSADADEQLVAALDAYLRAVQADPLTWRLVLMPPEGAPEMLRERIESGRAAIVALLAEVARTGAGPLGPSPDPELTARTLSALADEGARLVLTEPERFDAPRIVAHARWLLAPLGGAEQR